MGLKHIFALGSAVFFICGCSVKPEDKASKPDASSTVENEAVAQKKAALAPPSFADAMKNYKPLGQIHGHSWPLKAEVVDSGDKFATIIDDASANGSYAVLIWQNGQILQETYFPPYEASLRPDSASMHKSVLALAIGAAIAEGAIKSVEDRVGNYITEWKDDPRGDMKIRHLLEMSTGLKALSSEGGANSEVFKFFSDGPSARQTILNMPKAFSPGERFHYMNASSQLLCIVLETATGQAYTDYMSKKIWKPIGADDAYVWLNEADGFPRTYTGLLAIARDWLRLGLLVKDHGAYEGQQIIPKDFVSQMTSPSKTNINYGWQIWLGNKHEAKRYYNDDKAGYSVAASAPFAVDDIIYFDGFGGQRVYISRSMDLVVIRTGNVDPTWDNVRLINDVVSILKE